MEHKYDLSFGNSVCVREAFLNNYGHAPIFFSRKDLVNFNYPPYDGDPELIEMTRNIILEQTGQDYEHVFLTNGATGAVLIALNVFRDMNYTEVMTREAPYYIHYPNIISESKMEHRWIGGPHDRPVYLIDLPSNPEGSMDSYSILNYPLIIDGVYLNNIYMNGLRYGLPNHAIMIGSYSKLIGVNGCRIGWLATNSTELAPKIHKSVMSQYCGMDIAGSQLLKELLKNVDWETFELNARNALNYNREEWSKLEKFFEDAPVHDIGMFHYGSMDMKAYDLFKKAGIKWVEGSAMGTFDNFGRFNLGQSNKLVKEAVKEVLRLDTI